MFFLLYSQTITQTQTAVKNREVMSSISSLLRILKIRHSGPGCSFELNLMSGVFASKTPVSYSI